MSRRALLRAAVMAPGLWSTAAHSGERTIRIGWADWADAEAITCVANWFLKNGWATGSSW